MPANAFVGRTEAPEESDLVTALGKTKAAWDRLIADLAAESGLNIQEWNSYSKKSGWALKLKSGKRTILYLSPCDGCFLVSFALGAKAMEAARASALPARILKILQEAPHYAEGTAVRVEVHTLSDLPAIKKLAAAKLAN